MTYNIGSYIMFHQVKGTPFEFNSGAYDNLTMWEQIDNGDQYTPSKKFLMLVPIGLFLISTHYSSYNLNLFILNGLSCLCVVVPKLAFAHRLRVTLYWKNKNKFEQKLLGHLNKLLLLLLIWI